MTSKPSAKKPTTRKSSTKKTKYTKEQYLSWYEVMLRVRDFENRAGMLYQKQKIRGFCHLYIGQEAIAGALNSALKKEDPVITAYRQHGPALARGLSSRECMAELYGKYTGNVKGKGGSMHFFSKEHYFFGGHGIVGAQIPLGAGIAFADKYKGNDHVTFCMFGDGAARQGALHEAFNMAMTWKLPVVFICENNYYAMGTSVERTSNVTDIYKLGLAYDMPSFQVDGMSVETVHEAFLEAIERGRKGEGPTFLEIRTYRYKGHSMSDPQKYRTKDELNEYKELDPVKLVEQKLIEEYSLEDKVKEIKAKIKAEIDDAVEFSETSELPPPHELYEDVYVQKDYPYIK